MSSQAAHRRVARRAVARGPSRARVRRRRLGLVLVALVVGAFCAAVISGLGENVAREITLPLKHEDIIRQQAHDKNLDPALIAAVIYEESRFRDQTSHAGARGLMQITPQTADAIAKHSGGTRFRQSDLAEPQINISYGAYYLRLLIDHYGGNETLAIAAYNAGIGNVDRWVAKAGGPDEFKSTEHIAFPETRAYVDNVLERQGDYRANYASELGL
jgi:soluble lytic murein transglycosylase